jgi:hypothetical protein
MLDIMLWRWPFGHKGQLEMADNPVDNFMIIYGRNNGHPASTSNKETIISNTDWAAFEEIAGCYNITLICMPKARH